MAAGPVAEFESGLRIVRFEVQKLKMFVLSEMSSRISVQIPPTKSMDLVGAHAAIQLYS